MRDIPTEAIERVEILPEEVALKYGYRADQRVVNIVLRERFRSTWRGSMGRPPTEGGWARRTRRPDAPANRKEQRGRRSTFALKATTALTETERDIALDTIQRRRTSASPAR